MDEVKYTAWKEAKKRLKAARAAWGKAQEEKKTASYKCTKFWRAYSKAKDDSNEADHDANKTDEEKDEAALACREAFRAYTKARADERKAEDTIKEIEKEEDEATQQRDSTYEEVYDSCVAALGKMPEGSRIRCFVCEQDTLTKVKSCSWLSRGVCETCDTKFAPKPQKET